MKVYRKWKRKMTREEFKNLVNNGIVILDGGTGSHFIAAGMPKGVCAEKWILENPEVLMKLQGAYADAGSNIVYASTFGANRERLKSTKSADIIEKLNKENIALSKAATGGRTLIAGDMSMTGITVLPDEDDEDEGFLEAIEIYKEQAKLLDEGGCDLFVVETMINLEEARAAVKAIREVSDRPIMVSMTFEGARTLYGDSPETVAEVLTEAGADAIGANCSTGPANMKAIIEAMVQNTDLPVIAKPNAGLPHQGEDGRISYDMSAAEFAEEMMQLLDAGARIVGGCCGTGPEYIGKLAEKVKAR